MSGLHLLNPLFQDVLRLPGVGDKMRGVLKKLAGTRVLDLVFHLPASLIDRSHCPLIMQAEDGKVCTFTVTVERHIPSPPKSRAPYRVLCSDGSAFITLPFFNVKGDYLERTLAVGSKRIISGRVEWFQGAPQMPHPDYIMPLHEATKIPKLEPVYPLSAGITNRQLYKIMQGVFAKLPDLPEWIDPHYLKQRQWKGWKDTLLALHHPRDEKDLQADTPLRTRLAYDEILASQLALGLVRSQLRKKPCITVKGTGELTDAFRAAIPFTLTKGQEQVLQDICGDLASGERMTRLLQGDVGSGKTVVALLAMLAVAETGHQAAMMAPTEILARQHLAFFAPYAEKLGIRIALLTGSEKGKKRKELLDALEAGEIHILIGTHALFQDSVIFQNLALAVIDEQHRFGVDQRLKLAEKGNAHLLLMTATPIPRSLTMTLYGDMDCSRLTEKPASRKPIDTRAVPLSRLSEVVEGLKRALAGGAKIYWVCPLVEDSEIVDLAAAEQRYHVFQKIFGGRVGLVHGRMKGEERDRVMAGFAGDAYNILVATTVIEVGVNVPSATVIVIEQAERFGLAQLHQLRGRVGRGEKPSSCVLLYADNVGETGKKRLSTLRETEDGFLIAEEDLNIRGGGEILGTRQSGLPAFRFADFALHRELFSAARDDVRMILSRDQKLTGERGQNLRLLLRLFEYGEQVKYVES